MLNNILNFSKKIKKFFYFIIMFLKKHSTASLDSFRVVSVVKKNASVILKIQVVGKAAVFQCTLHEIIKDCHFLSGFSKNDIFVIAQLSLVTYEVISQKFEHANHAVFVLQNHEGQGIIEKSAMEIYHDCNIINKMNPKDAFRVGYVAALDHASCDQQ